MFLGTNTYASTGRLWVGSVSAQGAGQVEGAIVKLRALFKAYSESSEPERLLSEIDEASTQDYKGYWQFNHMWLKSIRESGSIVAEQLIAQIF